MTWVLIAIAWLGCGLLGAGYAVRNFQREFPALACSHYSSDLRSGLGSAAAGPVTLMMVFLLGWQVHGWGFAHVCPEPWTHLQRSSDAS